MASSEATKRKHVEREVLGVSDSILPDAQRGLEVVRVWASRGNNLHEVERDDGSRFLVSMPCKFRKRIWIKRGDFLLVCPIAEGDRVQAEVVAVLLEEQRAYIRSAGLWPAAFDESDKKTISATADRRGAQLVDARDQVPADMLPPSDSETDSQSDSEQDDDEAHTQLDSGAGNNLQSGPNSNLLSVIRVDK